MANIVYELETALPWLSRAVFSQPTAAAGYVKVTVRPVKLKGIISYQLEGIRDNKAYHQNLSADALSAFAAAELDGRYRQVLIVSGENASQYVLKTDGSYKKSGRSAVERPGKTAAEHNREKQYILCEGENIPALVDLGVFSADFHIVKSRYDKYKQINRFVELVNDAFKDTPKKQLTILDFGCGKSYLTFILYYYFTVKRGMDVSIIGYDLKADVVEHCNQIAQKYGYDKLRFVVADVTKDALYDEKIDMVVTLHACDIATDYALDYAIKKGAEFIFSVPCCQHEINSSIKKGGDLDIFLRHGVIKERMSALLTDSMRAGILEDMGYRVDMIEFIDFEHSPKNIMIRAKKEKKPNFKNIPQYKELCRTYGFSQTLLTLSDCC